MNANPNINILIAEDNEISRELMASVLKTQGYNVIPASDGSEAITVIQNSHVDLALLDLNMEPKGGFEFAKHLILNGISLPVVIVTADDSTDLLSRANEYGITRVLHKPVDPNRLLSLVENVLKRYGHNLNVIASERINTQLTPEQLMQKAIYLAKRNFMTRKGGPFGAVIANAKGEILGEGSNGITSRVDPTAHAEIMAIRQAAEKLGRSDLSDCVLYCSSEPTMMGQALIISVGITQVYYGLSHSEINEIRTKENKVRDALSGAKQHTTYTQIEHDVALGMFQEWQKIDRKIED